MVCKIGLRDHNRRRLGIVDRSSADFVGIRFGRGRHVDGIRKLMLLHLEEVRIPDDLTATANVVILRRNVIDVDLTEDGFRDEARVYDRFRGDLFFGIRALLDPLLKDLAGHEGILGHLTDGITGGAEILEQLFYCRSIVTIDHKLNAELIVKRRFQGKVGVNGLTAHVFRSVRIPALEVLAFDHRIRGREFQRLLKIIFIGLIHLTLNHKNDGEFCLGILSPDVENPAALHRSISMYLVGEISAAVYPLAGMIGLGGNRGYFIQAVAGIRINGFGGNQRSLIFFIEINGINDFIIVGNDGSISIGYPCRVDPAAGNRDLVTLAALDDFADGPEGVIVLTGNHGGKIIADGFALDDFHSLMDLSIPVIECDGPGILAPSALCHIHRRGVGHHIVGETGGVAADIALVAYDGPQFAGRATITLVREMPDTGAGIVIFIDKIEHDGLAAGGLPVLLAVQDLYIQDLFIGKIHFVLIPDRPDILIGIRPSIGRDLQPGILGQALAGHRYNGRSDRIENRLLEVEVDRERIGINDIRLVLLFRFGLALFRRRGRDAFLRDRTLNLIPVPGSQHRRGEQAQHKYEREQDRKYAFLHCVFPPDANIKRSFIPCNFL